MVFCFFVCCARKALTLMLVGVGFAGTTPRFLSAFRFDTLDTAFFLPADGFGRRPMALQNCNSHCSNPKEWGEGQAPSLQATLVFMPLHPSSPPPPPVGLS